MSTLPQDFGALVPGLLHAAATGVTEATATQLYTQMTVFDTVAVGGLAQLPRTNSSSTTLTVLNRCGTGVALTVIPDTDSEIEENGLNVGVAIPDGGDATFTCLDPVISAGRQWWLSGGIGGSSVAGIFVNVMAFGATGNGVTDDTEAFQKAAAAITAAGGGTLFIPRGDYILSATTQLSSNTSVLGVGYGSRLIVAQGFVNPGPPFPPGGGGDNIFSNVNWGADTPTDANINVSNVFIDCSLNPTFGVFSCVEFRMVTNVEIFSCWFLYGGDAVRFRGCFNARILSCVAWLQRNCAWDAFEAPCGDISVIGCFAHTNGTNQPLAFNSILYNAEPDNDRVFDGITIIGNTFIDDAGAPIQIEPLGSFDTNIVKNVTFANNVLKNVTLVFRGAVQGITVTGNVFSEITTHGSCLTSYVLFGGGIPTGVVVSGNAFIGVQSTTGFGIIRVESPGAIITGNYIDGMGASDGPCIYTGTTTGVILSGNSVSNGKIAAPQQVTQSNSMYVPNSKKWGTYDNTGKPVDIEVQSGDNNLIWNITGSTGAVRNLLNILTHSDTSRLLFGPSISVSNEVANKLTMSGGATSVSPFVSASGTDTNVPLRLLTQGTGGVKMQAYTIAGPPSTTTIDSGLVAAAPDGSGNLYFWWNNGGTMMKFGPFVAA